MLPKETLDTTEEFTVVETWKQEILVCTILRSEDKVRWSTEAKSQSLSEAALRHPGNTNFLKEPPSLGRDLESKLSHPHSP